MATDPGEAKATSNSFRSHTHRAFLNAVRARPRLFPIIEKQVHRTLPEIENYMLIFLPCRVSYISRPNSSSNWNERSVVRIVCTNLFLGVILCCWNVCMYRLSHDQKELMPVKKPAPKKVVCLQVRCDGVSSFSVNPWSRCHCIPYHVRCQLIWLVLPFAVCSLSYFPVQNRWKRRRMAQKRKRRSQRTSRHGSSPPRSSSSQRDSCSCPRKSWIMVRKPDVVRAALCLVRAASSCGVTKVQHFSLGCV